MSLYDTKVIRCYRCDKDIGEVDWEAVVIAPKCGDCANPYPKNDDLLPRTVRKVTKTKNKEQPIAEPTLPLPIIKISQSNPAST